MALMTKLCTNGSRIPGCGRELTLDSFSRNANGAPWPTCKDCVRNYTRLKKRQLELAPATISCTSCGETLPREAFSYLKGSGGALNPDCKRCVDRKIVKNWEAKNKARFAETGGPSSEGEKKCGRCGKLRPVTDFHVDSRRTDGRQTNCAECCSRYARVKRAERGNKPRSCLKCQMEFIPEGREQICPPCRPRAHRVRELRKLQAIPKWLTAAHRREIMAIYVERDRLTLETGIRHHVDHIIPLRGREKVNGYVIEVWGLHVPWNLRPLPGAENEKKSNRFLEASRAFSSVAAIALKAA